MYQKPTVKKKITALEKHSHESQNDDEDAHFLLSAALRLQPARQGEKWAVWMGYKGTETSGKGMLVCVENTSKSTTV